MKKTYMAKKGEITPQWYVIDAAGLNLGRLSSLVATRLRGKHKPEYTPNQLCGDAIIVINAEQVTVTGNKTEAKMYYSHTGHKLKSKTYKAVMAEHPTRILEHAIKGMLPKSKLGADMYRRLKVIAGTEHSYSAQKPLELKLN
ncbi:MAG: 50S ribosomal protein L13 [Candidatus Cloacimonadota bacterium]|nr:MAG: 50S ribosomal protein L13 [Candidatus Cloacimonadota bacterium]